MSLNTWINSSLSSFIKKVVTDLKSLKTSKQNKVSVGDNITLTSTEISATNTTYPTGSVSDIVNGESTIGKVWRPTTILQATKQLSTPSKVDVFYNYNTVYPYGVSNMQLHYNGTSHPDAKFVRDYVTTLSSQGATVVTMNESGYYNILVNFDILTYKTFEVRLTVGVSIYRVERVEYLNNSERQLKGIYYEMGIIYVTNGSTIRVTIHNDQSSGNLNLKNQYLTIIKLE